MLLEEGREASQLPEYLSNSYFNVAALVHQPSVFATPLNYPTLANPYFRVLSINVIVLQSDWSRQ